MPTSEDLGAGHLVIAIAHTTDRPPRAVGTTVFSFGVLGSFSSSVLSIPAMPEASGSHTLLGVMSLLLIIVAMHSRQPLILSINCVSYSEISDKAVSTMSNVITKAANYLIYRSMVSYESNFLPLLSHVLGELETIE